MESIPEDPVPANALHSGEVIMSGFSRNTVTGAHDAVAKTLREASGFIPVRELFPQLKIPGLHVEPRLNL
jgi:hypothetical protein